MDFEKYRKNVRVQVETALTMILERTVGVTFEPPDPFSGEDIETIFPEGLVKVTIPLGSGNAWHFLFQQPLAAVMGGLIENGVDDAPYDPDVHNSALGDLMQQTVAMLEMQILDLTGINADVGDPVVASDVTADINSWVDLPSIIWRIKIENWGEGILLKVMEMKEQPASGGGSSAELSEGDLSELFGEGNNQNDETGGFGQDFSTKSQNKPMSSATMRDPSKPSFETPTVKSAAFEDFSDVETPKQSEEPRNLDMLLDVSLPITIELGRTNMLVREVLELGSGSVIELEKLSGEPVDLYVNDKLFAKGEVVVIEENFGVRITELLKLDDRIKALK